MKFIRELIITILICVAGYLGWQSFQTKGKLGEFERRDAKLQADMDSIVKLKDEATLEAIRMTTDLNVAKRQLLEQAVIVETYRFRYEKIKNAPVPHLSDSAINSELSGLFKNR